MYTMVLHGIHVECKVHHDVHCMANGRLQEERNIEQMDLTGVQRTNGRPHIIVLHISIKENMLRTRKQVE